MSMISNSHFAIKKVSETEWYIVDLKSSFGIIDSNNNKKSYWQKNILEVFIFDWHNFIFYFNNIFNNEEIIQIIKSHAIKKKLFTLKSIMYIRSLNGLNTKDINKYYNELKIASNFNIILLYLFSFIPSMFYKIIYFIHKKS